MDKSFDISSLASTDEADLEVLDSGGQKTGWVWTFAGPAHAATVAIDNETNARHVAREQAKERAQVNGKKWKGGEDSPEELRERSINYVVARLLRWTEMQMNGEAFPCTQENARTFLADRRFGLVYDQANTFLMEEKAFTKRSAKS